jgi:chaperone BCS1
MSDGSLHRLFLALPKQCIVVIEDIDSAGIDREQGVSLEPVPVPTNPYDPIIPSNIPPPPPLPEHKRHRRVRNTVTLSGLLNAIDGNASQEGRLLIMTSNNPDILDAALTRPGRVDKRVYFGNMSKAAGKSIFLRMIGRWALAHDSGYSPEEIEQYASEFADKIPADTFTPAQVQNFLQDCRSDPLKALREVDAWVETTRNKIDAVEVGKSTPSESSESTTSTNSSTSIAFSSSTGTDSSEMMGDDGVVQGPV